MMPGVPERQTADYVRHGTTTLFAALEVATGKVIGSLHRRHRAEEFKAFLITLDKQVPACGRLAVRVGASGHGRAWTSVRVAEAAAHQRDQVASSDRRPVAGHVPARPRD